MTTHQKSYLALSVISIVWGITWVVSKHAINIGHIPALQLSGLRQCIAGLCFCTYYIAKGYGLPKRKDWGILLVLSILMFALSNGLSTIAVTSVGSGLGAVIGAITALWLAIFSYIILKQRITMQVSVGLCIGFAGILIIFYDRLPNFTNPTFTTGIILSIIATITWALGTIYTVKYSIGGNAWYNTGWQMLISGITLTACSYTQPRVPLSSIPYIGWVDVGILVLGGSILTFICFMYILQRLPAAQVSIYVYINPIIAVILGHYVFINSATLQEPLSSTLAIGACITLVGVYIVNKYSKVSKI